MLWFDSHRVHAEITKGKSYLGTQNLDYFCSKNNLIFRQIQFTCSKVASGDLQLPTHALWVKATFEKGSRCPVFFYTFGEESSELAENLCKHVGSKLKGWVCRYQKAPGKQVVSQQQKNLTTQQRVHFILGLHVLHFASLSTTLILRIKRWGADDWTCPPEFLGVGQGHFIIKCKQ